MHGLDWKPACNWWASSLLLWCGLKVILCGWTSMLFYFFNILLKQHQWAREVPKYPAWTPANFGSGSEQEGRCQLCAGVMDGTGAAAAAFPGARSRAWRWTLPFRKGQLLPAVPPRAKRWDEPGHGDKASHSTMKSVNMSNYCSMSLHYFKAARCMPKSALGRVFITKSCQNTSWGDRDKYR